LGARPPPRAALSLEIHTFPALTTANDGRLEFVADLERKLEGRTPFGMAYLRSRAVSSATHTYRMITCLDKLSSRRYQELHFVFAAIQKRVQAVFNRSRRHADAAPRLVLPLSEVDASMAERVGGKSANAGEVRNRLGLPAPDGFAVSTDAFRLFLSGGDLLGTIRSLQLQLDPDDSVGLNEISAQLQDLVRSAEVPPELAAAMLAAYDELADASGSTRVSVRSSAVGEDGEISFAGQYTSVLNVTRTRLLDAYKEVVASWFSPRALFYRSVHGIPDDDVPMGVLCMVMVEAEASGVACSVDPNRPDEGTLVIGGAWGLGAGPVGGSVSPDTWVVDRRGALRVRSSRLGWKELRVDPLADGDVAAVPIAPGERERFCLSESQVLQLSALVVRAEAHYGRPQELENAIDPHGRFRKINLSLLQK
jgi:pyruvate,water dikinase